MTGSPKTSPERFSRCSHSQNGVQLLNAKLRRCASRAGGVSCGTQNTNWNAPRRIRTIPLLPPLGVVLRAANQDSNDCRWQSYLCFVPRSGKGGAVGWLRAVHFTTQPTAPPQSRYARQLPLRGAKDALVETLPLRGSPGSLLSKLHIRVPVPAATGTGTFFRRGIRAP